MNRIINKVKHFYLQRISKAIRFNQLPWYLLIGPAGAGKSTLLANANIQFVLKRPLQPLEMQTIVDADKCTWYATPDAILVDVSGDYISTTTTASATRTLWQRFIAPLQKRLQQQALSGIIVTLPLSDLADRNNQEALALELQQRITELRNTFGKDAPFYFAITKCDLIPGFLDFFSESGIDELAQAWGITVPPLSDNDSLTDVFTSRFNALIKRLNKQLIWRLHQERGSFERLYVKDFPLQVERLKESLIQLLRTVTATTQNFRLQGVYLTSAMQSAEVNAPQQHLTANASQHALEIMYKPVMPSRSYFIRQFILQGIIQHSKKMTRWWQERSFVYTVCACAISVSVALASHDIFHGNREAYAMQADLQSYKLNLPQVTPQNSHPALNKFS